MECIINCALTSERLVLFVLGGEAFLSGYVTSTGFTLVLLLLLGVFRLCDLLLKGAIEGRDGGVGEDETLGKGVPKGVHEGFSCDSPPPLLNFLL